MENFNKLVKASAEGSKNQVQHILFTVKPGGAKIHASGSDNFMRAVYGSQELLSAIDSVLLPNITKEQVLHANTHQTDYDLLPCSPYSAEWKGSAKIRGVLRKILTKAGFGRAGNERKLGVGAPPLGWPEDISWTNYTGSTSSKLTLPQITHIIISMMEAVGLNPESHIVTPAVVATPDQNKKDQDDKDRDSEHDENDNIEVEDAIMNEHMVDVATVDIYNNDEAAVDLG